MSTAIETTFDNVNLNKVDPSSNTVPAGNYTFQIVDAGIKEYEKDGITKQRLTLGLAVAADLNGGKSAGRRIYETLFPGEMTDKQLKIVANAVGIQQETMAFPAWLEALKSQRPMFDAPVVEKVRKDTGAMETRVNFFGVKQASN